MSSESEYNGAETSSNSSPGCEPRPIFRPGSRHQSQAPLSPRKRRRAESNDTFRDRKRHLDGKYNNAYRILFNEDVRRVTALTNIHEQPQNYAAQIGASLWSAKEKSQLFAALERLGRDNIPAIAKAIGTKTIPETRDVVLLLQSASEKQADMKVTLRDIPAAVDIGEDCNARLELAGDALAWYQERFEAKQEQERYGKYWLITPALAEEIEDAVNAPRSRALSSSPAPSTFDLKDEVSSPASQTPIPQILQDIPEASLLRLDTMLALSKHLFMNRSSCIPSPWPHWSELVSELAAEPSLYRTALNDFHNLVVTLTRRLMQAAIMQTTSRLRSLRRRARKGVQPLVKRRDVLSAIDILGMKRNGKDRWKCVARRCGVRVFEGRFNSARKGKREIPWDEVERILELSTEPLSTDAETTDYTSGPEDSDGFKARAIRSGTPLPLIRLSSIEVDGDIELEDISDERTLSIESSLVHEADQSSVVPLEDQHDPELDQLERFDQYTSRQQEHALRELLGVALPSEVDIVKISEDETERSGPMEKVTSNPDGWRSWTEYRSPWEEFRNPVPASHFLANQKPINASITAPSRGPVTREPDLLDEDAGETDTSSNLGAIGKRRSRAHAAEIPIRGARAYAALQEKISAPAEGSPEHYNLNETVDDWDINLIVESVEHPASEGEEMDWGR